MAGGITCLKLLCTTHQRLPVLKPSLAGSLAMVNFGVMMSGWPVTVGPLIVSVKITLTTQL
ncbi:protein of unknown function [Xenorhabdus bovienii]|uniref:Uncharacterized protein n=1 Tax=Xenorhabdus bovienii TaxID=40576 RepID=A0A0B6X7C7_XENBV|nr:protein of unknown function [Xenorhabdus bovienii]